VFGDGEEIPQVTELESGHATNYRHYLWHRWKVAIGRYRSCSSMVNAARKEASP